MSFYSCDLCGEEGPTRPESGEAEEAALLSGFVCIFIPKKSTPLLKEGRFFCSHCAKHLKTHFVVESHAPVLDAADDAFERDTGW